MVPGFHTAGLLLHDPVTAIEELAHLGYRCVALRPHAATLNPSSPLFPIQFERIQDAISRTGLGIVLDLDGRYIDHPYQLRSASLADQDDAQSELALKQIQRWVETARQWSCGWVSFSSGRAVTAAENVGGLKQPTEGEWTSPDIQEESLDRLAEKIESLFGELGSEGPRLAIRPRVGDLIGSVAKFEQLLQWLPAAASEQLGLAADIGEMLAAGEFPFANRLERNLDRLAVVYVCDRAPGDSAASVADQTLGEGEVAIDRILIELNKMDFVGPAVVRVEGHPELGLRPAQEAITLYETLV